MFYNKFMSVQIIDLIILVMGLSILISAWKKGFLRQLTDLIALIASIGLSVYITRRYSLDTQWLFFLFAAMRFVFGLMQSAFLPRKHSFLSLLDRIAALLAGCARIYVICALLFWALSYVPSDWADTQQSVIYQYFKEVDTYVRQTAGF